MYPLLMFKKLSKRNYDMYNIFRSYFMFSCGYVGMFMMNQGWKKKFMSKFCKQAIIRCVLWHLSWDAAVRSIWGRVLHLGGNRAGIGSLRAFKYYTAHRYLDKMHGGMRESAESRHIKGTICIPWICDTCFPVSQYMRHQDKMGSSIVKFNELC